MDSADTILEESKTEDHNFLNIIIKEEPLDIYEPVLGEITIKDEPDESYLAEEQRFIETSCDNTNEEAFSSSSNSKDFTSPIVTPSLYGKTGNAKISNNQGPVTKKLVINGQEKMCVIVKMPQVNRGTVKSIGMSRNPNTPISNTNKLKVQCPRCKNTIAMDAFRLHIDSCPPRQVVPRRYVIEKFGEGFEVAYKTKGDSHQNYHEPDTHNAGRKMLQQGNEIVQAVFKPSLGEAISIVDEKYASLNSSKSASILVNTRPVKLQSEHPISSASIVQKSLYSKPQNNSITKSRSLSLHKYEIGVKKNLYLPGRPRSKSCSMSFINDVERKSAESDMQNVASKGACRRIRSKSVHRDQQANLKLDDEDNKINLLGADVLNKNNYASHTPSHQKLLEVQSKSHTGKADPSAKGADKTNASVESEATRDNSLLLDDNTLSCSLCSFTTDKRRTLQDHERHHRRTNQPILVCVYCNQKYAKHALYIHIQNVHAGQPFQLVQCTPEEPKSSESDTVTIPKPYICRTCPFSAESIEVFQFHMKTHTGNQDVSTNASLFSCTKCSYTTCRLYALKVHQVTHAKKLAIMQCWWCDFKSTAQALRSHKKKCNKSPIAQGLCDQNDVPRNGKIAWKFSCTQCSYRSTKRAYVKFHEATHKKNLAIEQCCRCEFRSTIMAVRSHERKCRGNPRTEPTNDQKLSGKLNAHETSVPILSAIKKGTIECASPKESANTLDNSLLLKDNTLSCSLCSFTTDKRRTLQDHKRHHLRSNQPILQCFYCNQKYSKYALYTHIQKVHPGLKFQYANEPKASEGDDSVIEPMPHVETDSKKQNSEIASPFSCSQCSYKCTRQAGMIAHQVGHKNNFAILQCHGCEFKSTRTALRWHELKCTQQADDQTPSIDSSFRYKCMICSYSCQNKRNLDVHERGHENNMPILSCPNGNCTFRATRLPLKAHMIKWCEGNADNMEIKTKRSTFKCLKCPFSSYLRVKLNRHIKKRHTSCPVTDKSQYKLDIHMRSHKSYVSSGKCGSCDYTANKHALRRHFLSSGHWPDRKKPTIQEVPNLDQKTKDIVKDEGEFKETELLELKKAHWPDREKLVVVPTTLEESSLDLDIKEMAGDDGDFKEAQFHCSQCLFTTNLRIKLRSHLKIHEGNRSFKCRQCSFVTTLPRRSYEQDSVEKCRKCGFKSTQVLEPGDAVLKPSSSPTILPPPAECSFTTSTQLEPETHMEKLHENVFKCEFCSVVSTHQYAFNKHMICHQQNQPVIKCSYCSFKSTASSLKTHVKSHSKQERDANVSQKLLGNLRCNLCSYASSKLESFRKHLVIHEQGQLVRNRPHCRLRSTEGLYLHTKGHKQQKIASASEVNVRQSSSEKYMCSMCSFISTRRNNYNRHLITHNQHQPVKKCHKCSFTSTPRYLARHVEKHSITKMKSPIEDKEVLPETPQTPKTISGELPLEQYHTVGQPSFQCQQEQGHYDDKFLSVLEKRNSSQSSELSSDGDRKGGDMETTEGDPKKLLSNVNQSATFQCSLCSFTTRLRIQLNVHKRKKHAKSIEAKSSAEDNSGSRYSRIEDDILGTLPVRSSRKNGNTKGRPKSRKFSCTLCSFATPFELKWKKHVNAHNVYNLPIFQCLYCGFKGTSKMVQLHARNCASPKTYSKKMLLNCPKCSFATYYPAALTKHRENDHTDVKGVKIIGPIKSFKCGLCSFTTYWQYLFKRHMQSHTVLNLPIAQCT